MARELGDVAVGQAGRAEQFVVGQVEVSIPSVRVRVDDSLLDSISEQLEGVMDKVGS